MDAAQRDVRADADQIRQVEVEDPPHPPVGKKEEQTQHDGWRAAAPVRPVQAVKDPVPHAIQWYQRLAGFVCHRDDKESIEQGSC